MSLIGRVWERYEDWLFDFRDSSFVSFTKFFGSGAAALGIIVSPFIYRGIQNGHRLQNTCDHLDKTGVAIFTSVSDCVRQGFKENECECSQAKALDIAGSLGTEVSYNDYADCMTNHGTATQHTTLVPMTVMAGKVPITTYHYVTSYTPDIIGWEAAKENMCDLSVPLYSSTQSGAFVRGDGAVLQLTKN